MLFDCGGVLAGLPYCMHARPSAVVGLATVRAGKAGGPALIPLHDTLTKGLRSNLMCPSQWRARVPRV